MRVSIVVASLLGFACAAPVSNIGVRGLERRGANTNVSPSTLAGNIYKKAEEDSADADEALASEWKREEADADEQLASEWKREEADANEAIASEWKREEADADEALASEWKREEADADEQLASEW